MSLTCLNLMEILQKQSSVGSNEMTEHCHWDPLVTHQFLLLLSERAKTTHGTSIKSSDYKIFSDKLFDKFGRRFEVSQLSSKYHRLQKIYNYWRALMQHTGFGWDHVSQTPTCPNEIWQEYVKQNKGAKKFVNKGLVDKDLYEVIFEKQNATGRFAYTSASQPVGSSVHVRDIIEVDIGDDEFEPDSERTTGEKRANTSACARSVDKKKKKVQEHPLTSVIGRLTDAIFDKSMGANTTCRCGGEGSQENTSVATDPFSMQKCYELLTSMQVESKLVMKIVRLLVDKPQWREMFVSFTPEHREYWVYNDLDNI